MLYWHTLRMTINWSTVSFTSYLLHYQLKFLEGSIFVNNNYSAISDFIAIIVGSQMFYHIGVKKGYMISFTSGCIGGSIILYLEYYNKMMRERGLDHQQLDDLNKMFYSRMPWAIFIAKFGTASGFLISYMASFADNRIFPIQKRATAIGFCNLIGRTLTSTTPMINEFEEPLPMYFFIGAMFIAWLYNFTFNLPDFKK